MGGARGKCAVIVPLLREHQQQVCPEKGAVGFLCGLFPPLPPLHLMPLVLLPLVHLLPLVLLLSSSLLPKLG